jgi:ABC-type multidrug transport system permease subunit
MGYPLVVFVVSTVFMWSVFRQYQRRRRPYQLVWVLSLATASLGSLAYIVFLEADKAELAFRLYYIFGAMLSAPLLGLGSMLLASRSDRARRVTCGTIIVVAILALLGAMSLLTNGIHLDVLQRLDGGPGTNPDVYKAGPWLPIIAVLNSFGALAVFGVAVYSGWQVWRRRGSPQFLAANCLIALGTLIIAEAGGTARLGLGVGLFWLTMAVGWVVLYGGFLLTSTLHRPVPAAPNPTTSMAAPA